MTTIANPERGHEPPCLDFRAHVDRLVADAGTLRMSLAAFARLADETWYAELEAVDVPAESGLRMLEGIAS